VVQKGPLEEAMPCVLCLQPWECCAHVRQESSEVHEGVSLRVHISPACQFSVIRVMFDYKTRNTHDSDDIADRFWGLWFGSKA
jgi:hypothetical protein